MGGYRRLKEGEIIREGDEVDACRDGWRDAAVWRKVKNTVGRKAPNPIFPSHSQYRRKINKAGNDYE